MSRGECPTWEGELSRGRNCPGGNVRGEVSRGKCPTPLINRGHVSTFASFCYTHSYWQNKYKGKWLVSDQLFNLIASRWHSVPRTQAGGVVGGYLTRSSADADNELDAFVGQSRSTNILGPFQVK